MIVAFLVLFFVGSSLQAALGGYGGSFATGGLSSPIYLTSGSGGAGQISSAQLSSALSGLTLGSAGGAIDGGAISLGGAGGGAGLALGAAGGGAGAQIISSGVAGAAGPPQVLRHVYSERTIYKPGKEIIYRVRTPAKAIKQRLITGQYVSIPQAPKIAVVALPQPARVQFVAAPAPTVVGESAGDAGGAGAGAGALGAVGGGGAEIISVSGGGDGGAAAGGAGGAELVSGGDAGGADLGGAGGADLGGAGGAVQVSSGATGGGFSIGGDTTQVKEAASYGGVKG